MKRKLLFVILLGCSIIMNGQNQTSIIKDKRFGVFAGIGLTNVFEFNKVNRWPKYYTMPFTIESKPSVDVGLSYTLPIIDNLIAFKSEFGILACRYDQNTTVQGSTLVYINHFESLSLKGLGEFRMPLVRDTDMLLFGMGPSVNFTSSTSKTEQNYASRNIGNSEYSNKFFLGAKAYVGLARYNSVIKFDYNWVKMSSSNRDIPFAPFYTLGITYEHKIF
jgi:hypothetical protein